MALPLKPHTLTLIQAGEVVIGGVVEGIGHELTLHTIRGMVTPLSAVRSLETYGVEIDAPHQFMFEIADRESVKVGNRYQDQDGRVFVVTSPVQIWNAEPRTKHAHCQLDDLSAKGPLD